MFDFLYYCYFFSQLILYPPSDLQYLYYKARPKGVLHYDYPNRFLRDLESIDSKSVIFGSSVNVDNPNLNLFPLYRYATPIRVLLKPGDVLYLPSFWHHEVQSLPDPASKLNFAINFWFQNISSPIDEKQFFKK